MNQRIHSQPYQSSQQVALKLKNCSCGKNKVLKHVVQVSCPIQQNGVDCGLFAGVICLHIIEGTHIDPHIFTQYEIMKLRPILPRLLVKDRNERNHDIHAILDCRMAPLPSELLHQGAIPRSPLGGVELPKTIKLIAGGSSVGTISFKPTRYRKLLYGNLFYWQLFK